jgi:uncharacterized protein YutE (UPF0331/DUF86 family)
MTELDTTILTEKLAELARFIAELESVLTKDYETFRSDVRNVRTAERDLELLVEHATDVVGLLVASQGDIPARSYRDAFERTRVLCDLSDTIVNVLIELATLRNRLVHEYGDVYDERLAYHGFVKAPDAFRQFAHAVIAKL